ncbi:MAG: hypothetical protein MR867_01415 [Eubacterium sp.]|nr:hypothetical protein [Eubacterium sp.]MDD7208566.1 hypothetical protein [Lachnospiraceae bacterium]MDY5498393.1 hypothetical protein [Anaerobutyricum sp.]
MTISENIIIGEQISHDAKKILRGVRHPSLWKNGLWFGVTTAVSDENLLYILPCREMKMEYYKDVRLLGLAASMKEAYEIVLKLVRSGYNNDCITRMKSYLDQY